MQHKDRSTSDTATLLLITFVGIFIVGSMIALIVLAFEGQPGGESVWAGLFSLSTAILGAVGGYLGGTAVEQRRKNVKAVDE